MRIGELLVEQKKLRRGDLDRALAEQQGGRRIASLLIASGLVEFDDAARALGEQQGVPCALAKHLTGRDPALAKLIPAELGRSSCALPIGRTSKGALIVCVRDPAPALLEMLQRAAKTDVMMVVAPAQRLEHLIGTAYGGAPENEFDVDFSSQVEVPPPPPNMTVLDPDSVRLALTDLDDARVDKNFTQSGQLAISRTPTGPSRITLELVKSALERATTRDAATDAVMGYVANHWHAALMLAVRDGNAVGYRGHNVRLPETISLRLAQPSTLQQAFTTKQPSNAQPKGSVQEALREALAEAQAVAVAPVIVRGMPVAMLAVGDPIGHAGEAFAHLGSLAEMLGKAYEQLTGAQ
jgi:hypothetical protein